VLQNVGHAYDGEALRCVEILDRYTMRRDAKALQGGHGVAPQVQCRRFVTEFIGGEDQGAVAGADV
jgi:hypothetical protein